MTVSKQETALALAARGFDVFPIKEGAKRPPLVRDWPRLANSRAEVVADWWQMWPQANIGIHCDGLVVLDVDPKKGGDATLERLDMIHGLPDTLVSRTPSGGRHLFYRLPDGHPGVPNGVSVLGAGLDVRSRAGYVVAPGSQIGNARYQFENDLPIADAPEWLVQKLGVSAKREQPAKVNVPPAEDEVLERAREWLRQWPGAVEGQNGDTHTYQTACRLRDFGVSEAQAAELLTTWNTICSPPWSPQELAIKVRNAYHYGQNEPGSAPLATADAFTAVPAEPAAARPKARLTRLADFATAAAKGPGYLVKGLLQRRSYAELFGAPGQGKTFVALDLAYHVAAGRPWMGRKVHAGPALYLAFEGQGGFAKRAQALRQMYGEADVPLYIAGGGFNLREMQGRRELGELLAELPTKPALIVIDTFAHALCGGDENSAQDVSAFNAGVQALIEATGACIMVIHHSGKDKARGARGSSALQGALDTEIEVDGWAITARKQRDIELTPAIGFRLKTLLVGIDEDGDELTSCVVEPADVPASGLTVQRQALKGQVLQAWDVLRQLRPDNAPVSPLEWKQACIAEFLEEKKAKRAMHEYKMALRRRGLIAIDDNGLITRRLE